MYRFHVLILARPADARRAGPTRLREQDLLTLANWSEPAPFPLSFEETAERLSQLPRMFVEPDGAWVWAGDGWQLDGMLVDRGGRLLHVEAKGNCPAVSFDRLLVGCGWPEAALAFELVREGVRLDEAEFRRFASA